MYDKTVRRRRAVLALLVVLSLILLTAYFGESSEGGLHSVQRGFLTVVSPIQEGANKALKPVRDLFSWFGDTLHAKDQLAEVRKQKDKLLREVIAERADEHGYHELLGLYHLDQLSLDSYRPVTATVVGKSPNLWYSTIWIDKGTSSGVRKNDPVVNEEGLVGKVAQAAPDGAVVDLITDSEVGVSARINGTNATGVVQPKVGEPNDLVLQYLPGGTAANRGENVVTSGTVESPDDSLVSARDPDRAGQLRRRRRRVQVGQRSSARRPAQPQRRAGADVYAGQQAGAAGQPPGGLSERRSEQQRRQRSELAHVGLDERRRMTPSGSLLTRIAVLVVVVVFFQIGVVSEVPVFGVAIDLSPLVVAFVGLMCGSTIGAATGFAVGLLVDLALVQTLGLTSLIFTLVGYWCGRLRELRDPQAALTPLLVGGAATAVSLVGYSLMEFMLGVDAPVSLELLRQIVFGVLLNTIVALPMWILVRRCLIGGLPPDPRRRRRRAYTTGGLSPLSRS